MRKGLYEIFTTFFFVIILVVVLLFGLVLSGQMTILKSQTSESRLKTSLAKETFNAITRCNEQQILDEAKIEHCRKASTITKAVKVVQPAFTGCSVKTWGASEYELATKDTNAQTFSYWVNMKQTTGQICLAELLIVI
ncbi:MAG: hypothetical protein OXR66_06805 [Candidatus Woesearchaeota archaeon]|nr:hypothetical protein [Candidatus Woesearchaeota archaeon]